MFGGYGTGLEKTKKGEVIMKLRDMLLLVVGGLLVISGMVLNTLLSGDANAQEGVKDGEFGYITCRGIIIKTGIDKIKEIPPLTFKSSIECNYSSFWKPF